MALWYTFLGMRQEDKYLENTDTKTEYSGPSLGRRGILLTVRYAAPYDLTPSKWKSSELRTYMKEDYIDTQMSKL